MKILMTHFLTVSLWLQALAIPLAYSQDDYDPFAGLDINIDAMDGTSVGITDQDGDGLDDMYEGLTEEEIALLLAQEQLAQNRADCDDGKGGIEVGIITVKKQIEDSDEIHEEKVDCNQIAFLEYKLLEPELGEDMAFQCVTKNWYVDEQVKFAKELEVPLGKKFCKDKMEASAQQSMASKAKECSGSVVCNMLKSPLGDAIGFDPLSELVEFATQGTDFGKGCKDTPGDGCLSNVIWGLFKNIFTNIEGFWDLGKLLVNGVIAGGKWVAGKVADGAKWVGNKVSDGWTAVSNWWSGTEEPENTTSAKQDVIAQQDDGWFKDFLSDPIGTTGAMASSLMTGLFDMIVEGTKDNFMCGGDYYKYEGNFTDADYGSKKTKQNMAQRGWEEITHFGGDNEPSRHDQIRCDQPFIAECASCGQWMNMACGLTGFLGGEVVTAVLTGGAVNVIGKGASAAGKAASGVSKALKSTKAWQKVATKADDFGKGFKSSKAFKGLENLKGAYKGGTEFLAGLPGRLPTGLVKNGKNLAMILGKTVIALPKAAGKGLLAALRKGKAMAKKMRLDKAAGLALKAPKAYLRVLDNAFVLGMQGKQGLKIARMAREGTRIRNEMKGLQTLAENGDETARTLMASKQRRLNLLDEHQRLTRDAMKTTDEGMRARLLEDAKIQAGQLDDAAAQVARSQKAHDEAVRLAKSKLDDAATDGNKIVGGVDNAANGTVGNNIDNVAPGPVAKSTDNVANTTEEAARSGVRNVDTRRNRMSVSRKPASRHLLENNPRLSQKFDELKSMKGPNGTPAMTDAQQSYARALLNNVHDVGKREELIKKIADDGWDSLRRSCK